MKERWEQELDSLLHELHVCHEEVHPQESSQGNLLPEITYIRPSKQHYGAYYRMDLIADEPELRVGIPIDTGPWKLALYVVRLTHKQLPALFTATMNVQGSEVLCDLTIEMSWLLTHKVSSRWPVEPVENHR